MMFTEDDVLELADLYHRQYGVPEADSMTVINDWRPVFIKRKIPASKVKEAMVSLLEEGPPLRKDHRLRAILKACGPSAEPAAPLFMRCEVCDNVGCFTVPHPKDYTPGGHWKGEYTAVVRCMCGHGNQFGPCMTMPLYEDRHPNWREEMAIRRVEWKMRRLDVLSRREEHPDLKADYEKKLSFAMRQYDALFAGEVTPQPQGEENGQESSTDNRQRNDQGRDQEAVRAS